MLQLSVKRKFFFFANYKFGQFLSFYDNEVSLGRLATLFDALFSIQLADPGSMSQAEEEIWHFRKTEGRSFSGCSLLHTGSQ